MDLYAENILDHFKNPRNKGEIVNPTVEHEEVNLSCGDKLTIQLSIENDVIKEIQWNGTGCAISIGATSILSEELEGKSVEEISELSMDDVKKLLGVPISQRRLKCAMLCLHTIKNTLHAIKNEAPQSWSETIGQNDEHNEK
ncbi:iron-sulfur cluster assembly scaffold protein [Patescibacteria group bacterium]|nr:iron-sulfur cluster assembly scaffold protein [Patescibacteria group bacterium]